jgi:hypothetical protein
LKNGEKGMGIEMYLADSRKQAESVAKLCDSQIDGYHNLQIAINDFYLSSQKLRGKAYDSAKEYFRTILQPLSEGGILLSETIKKAVSSLPQECVNRVDSCDWKEYELIGILERLDLQIKTLYMIRRHLGNPLSSDAEEHAFLDLNQEQIDLYENIRNGFSRNLERLGEFDAASPDIFSEINLLESSLNQGLEEANEAWDASTGTFKKPRDLSWANFIHEKWQNREVRRRGIDEKLNKKLKKYKIKSIVYTISEGNSKVLWVIEDKKTGVYIDDPELYQYLNATGKYLDLDNIEFVTLDFYQEE